MSKSKNNSVAAANKAPEAELVLGDFDPRVVHYRDSKTGRVIRANPFRVIVERGIKYYEHPVGSGNLWFEDRHPAGRIESGSVVPKAPHKLYVPPETIDQKVARESLLMKQENEKLKKELEAIEREKQASLDVAKSKSKAEPKEKDKD